MIQMQLGGLGFDPKNMSPIVLLRDTEERNFLPIWIGMFEAAAIAMELQEFKPPRPMTHDLLTKVINDLGGKVVKVIGDTDVEVEISSGVNVVMIKSTIAEVEKVNTSQ